MWELDYKESWALKNWCFWAVVLDKTLESPLDCKEIKPANPKGNQSWIFNGRTDAEAESPILWPPDVKNRLWKRSWFWERLKVGGEGDDRGWDGWVTSSIWWTWVWVGSRSWWWTGKPDVLHPMGHKESDRTERLNWDCVTLVSYSLVTLYSRFHLCIRKTLMIALKYTLSWYFCTLYILAQSLNHLHKS